MITAKMARERVRHCNFEDFKKWIGNPVNANILMDIERKILRSVDKRKFKIEYEFHLEPILIDFLLSLGYNIDDSIISWKDA